MSIRTINGDNNVIASKSNAQVALELSVAVWSQHDRMPNTWQVTQVADDFLSWLNEND